jgi:hypothetical protein
MPDFSSNLELPYLLLAQAQKHVTVIEALRTLEALAQAAVESATITAEPTAPQDGTCYSLPPGKTGSTWSSYATGTIANWGDGIWQEITPKTGWRVSFKDSGEVVCRRGEAWRSLTTAENLLLNASFAIYKRAISCVVDGGYGLDRWFVATEGGALASRARRWPAGRLPMPSS